jgi:hypothetical protein
MTHANDAPASSDICEQPSSIRDIAIFPDLGSENGSLAEPDESADPAGSVDSGLPDYPADPRGSIDTADRRAADLQTDSPSWLSSDAGQQSVSGPSTAASLTKLGLYAILAVQAVLSLRLMWSNTAFLDEATYLYVGHVEIAHWLHGTSVPAYATYLSGAPVIYPPLAAIANDIGGLAAARVLSMLFMLGATCTLWGLTRRLTDTRSAFFAAAIFVALGPTQYLGAFSTYDAMALFLMTAAAWCVVAARDRADSTALLVAGAFLLAFANATKYATALFDPVVIALGALTIAAHRGAKPGLGRAGHLAVIAVGMLAALLAVGGPFYVTGVLSTTLARATGGASPWLVLTDAAKWIGLVCVLAVVGVIVSAVTRQNKFLTATLALLAAAGLLAPLNQARILTTTSLSKHVDFGAWFAAAAAGYAIARLSRVTRWKAVYASTGVLALAAVVLPIGFIGVRQAGDFFQAWPNSSQATQILRSLAIEHPGNLLAEDYDVDAYYMENSVNWNRWADTWYFRYVGPPTYLPITGPTAYQEAIRHHYFSLIILDFGDTASMDRVITEAIRQSGDYHVIAEAPYWDKFGIGRFTIWAYQPAKRQQALLPAHVVGRREYR